MESENFDRSLRAFQRRRPFQVFTVELVSGETMQVDHPEALVVRGGVAVYISPTGVPSILDHESVSQIIGEAILPAWAYCTIPLVNRINAVSRFTSSSFSMVSRYPALISRIGMKL